MQKIESGSRSVLRFHRIPDYDTSELEKLFSFAAPMSATSGGNKSKIDLRRATNTEIMLRNIKIPIVEIVDAVLAMDDASLDVEQVENILKYIPTQQEMEKLKYFMELM
ncbi:hypothetical protein CTI12_AA621160 [Artemisia annua]|uniref:FH2 domain-containing protein n=1 Tax=Artemisia annua TaxID=35608 RepID=A0A2U1KBT9_ARTAN|nr:hypothetical protein CTI12_AA621160 [Artemisia annua]